MALSLMLTKRIGRKQYHFTVQGNNLHDVILESQRLSFESVDACGLCGSDNLSLNARVAQGKFKYVSVRCLDCGGDLTFGKTQEDADTYFLRRKPGSKEFDWKTKPATDE